MLLASSGEVQASRKATCRQHHVEPLRVACLHCRTQTLLVYARYDLTFPVDLSEILIREFNTRGLPHEVVELPCGHYSTGVAPFNFLDAYVLTRFLRKRL